jgi:hypothetical protein
MQTLFPPAPSDHGAHQKQIGISSLSLTRRDLLYLKQFFFGCFLEVRRRHACFFVLSFGVRRKKRNSSPLQQRENCREELKKKKEQNKKKSRKGSDEMNTRKKLKKRKL